MQKNHLEDQIIDNKNDGVQTRRKAKNTEQVKFYLMIEMEPKTYDEANESEKWIRLLKKSCGRLRRTKHGNWFLDLQTKMSLGLNGCTGTRSKKKAR